MNDKQIPVVSVEPELKLLYNTAIEVDDPLLLGRSPYGERRIINITGGSFSGDRLSGRVLSGGADWQIIRADGVAELQARYTLETGDGALIYVTNRGLRHASEDTMKRLAAGEDVDPKNYYFRTTPVFETGSPEYSWLNGIVSIAVGERRAKQVILSVYELL
ncbi:MAG: DUF3237 domain-containing protein [SAR324 cluster bacterium]|nr:DUF3237 domain-containing protein [SAR324 cluster bacterium]